MKRRCHLYCFLLCFALILGACTPGNPSTEPGAAERGQAQPPPTLDPDATVSPDIERYAEDMGLTLEEAVWRMNVQEALSASGLQPALMENEAETFAGLWLEHEPEYRVVVAFTRDGEATIAPYLEGKPFADAVEVRDNFRYSYAELRQAQEEAMAMMQELGIPTSSGSDIQQNQVTITVGNPQLLQEELDAAGLELPEPVVVQAVDPDSPSESLRGGVARFEGPDGGTIYFPMQGPGTDSMDALLEGTLVLDDNGCLRVGGGQGPDPLVIWRYGFSVEVSEGEVTVTDDEGQPVGRVGAPIRAGGGMGGADSAIPGMPLEACPGPTWILGGIEPLAAQAIPDITLYPFGVGGAERPGVLLSQSKPAPAEDVLTGTLTLEGHCLRAGGHTILWPPDIYPDEETDPLTLVYRVPDEPGQVVAVLGEEVTLPGSERTASDYRFFENKVDCPAPFWGAAIVEQEN